MSRMKMHTTGSGSRNAELPHHSPRTKDITWDPSIADPTQIHRRNSTFTAALLDKESTRLDDERPLKMPHSSIEERLLILERDITQLVSTPGITRTMSEFGQEQISELDFVRWKPKNEIVRISSDDWHEKRNGKFAVPEASVLTVSTTTRHWAGRHVTSGTNPSEHSLPFKAIAKSDTALTEVAAERPYRLAICGYELHRELEKIFGLPVSLTNNVWIWPFKHFLTYKPKIRQRLEASRALVRESDEQRLRDGRPIGENVVQSSAGGARNMSVTSVDGGPDETIGEDERYESSLRLKDQLKCLVDFMEIDMKELFSVKEKIEAGTLKTIGFDYLWLLYKPGDLLFTSATQKRAYVVLHVTGGRAILDIGDQPSTTVRHGSQPVQSWEQHEDQAVTFAHSKNTALVIDTFYIDFDGDNFGPVPRKFVIQEYEGEQEIVTLPAYPAVFDNDIQKSKDMLKERGKKFVKLAGVAHRKYAGLSAREPSVADWQEEVNSDIVIDFAEAIKKIRRDNANWLVGLGVGVVDQASRADRREINEIKPCATKGCTLCKQSDIFDDSQYDLERRSEFLDNTTLLRYRAYGKDSLDDDQIILLPPRVYGYSLLDRYWYPLNIDLIENIKSSSHNGFDDLVLPGDHKRIMQALVKHHTRGSRPTFGKTKTASDYSADLVRGKGRGLIILLHGVPGVGKTSTAECVAAQTKRPLFPITCGDIGTTASEVESRLEQYFDLAHKWGCVLLLDEADVYLATREKGGDLQRNSLVSVFLRVLEYYSGILILTTNRVGEFDEAFKSRIHISLYYPRLDRRSTIKIWKMNLNRVERNHEEGQLDIDVEEDRIMRFAEKHWESNSQKPSRRWNGRQIKNAFQTAIALATWDFNDEQDGARLARPRLTDRHFDIVSQTSAHFDDYLSQVHQIDDDEIFGVIAGREGLRADDARQIHWDDRRGSGAKPKSSGRRAIRNAARDQSDYSDDDDTEDRSDEYEERRGGGGAQDRDRDRDRDRGSKTTRLRKSSTKDKDHDDDDEDDDEDEAGRPDPPRTKSSMKDSSYYHDDDHADAKKEKPPRRKPSAAKDYEDEDEEEWKERMTTTTSRRPAPVGRGKSQEEVDDGVGGEGKYREREREKGRRKSKPKIEDSEEED